MIILIRTLTATLNHVEICPMLGRNSAPHIAVSDVLAHMVKKCGITDAAVVESPVAAADGNSTNADVVYVDNVSGKRVILEVSIVTVGSDSSLAGRGVRGPGLREQKRCCGSEKRRNVVMA